MFSFNLACIDHSCMNGGREMKNKAQLGIMYRLQKDELLLFHQKLKWRSHQLTPCHKGHKWNPRGSSKGTIRSCKKLHAGS